MQFAIYIPWNLKIVGHVGSQGFNTTPAPPPPHTHTHILFLVTFLWVDGTMWRWWGHLNPAKGAKADASV